MFYFDSFVGDLVVIVAPHSGYMGISQCAAITSLGTGIRMLIVIDDGFIIFLYELCLNDSDQNHNSMITFIT